MSTPLQYLLSSRSHQRKLSLQKLLSSTDITLTKNGIRNIIQTHTQSVVQPYIMNNVNSTLVYSRIVKQPSPKEIINNFITPKEDKLFKDKINTQIQTKTPGNQTYQKLQKLNQTQSKILTQLKEIKKQISNIHKPKNQKISFNSNQYNTWQQWMGKVFSQVFQRAYQLFSTQKLTYNQMRAFCCQKILLNLIQFQKQIAEKDNNKKSQQLQYKQQHKQLSNHHYHQEQSCNSWQTQARKIMQHQCNKYPQITQKLQVNKKLQQIVKKNLIDNFENDDYDFVDKTGVVFKYKQSGDYTQEIMLLLNEVIGVTQRQIGSNNNKNSNSNNNKNTSSNNSSTYLLRSSNTTVSSKSNIYTSNNNNKSLFNNFHIFFSNVFNLVNHRDHNIDMDILLNSRLNDYQYCKFRFSQQQDIQYFEKVQSYTKVQIGTKIPLNSQTYSFDEIVSGNIQIKNKQVARVIEKWIDQLQQKLLHPQKYILERIHRFKSNIKGQKIKLSSKQKQLLVNKLTQQRKIMLQFKNKIIQNIESLSQQLMSNLGNLSQLTFMQQTQRAMGEFACKMQQASVEYSLQQLNQVIGALLKAVQKMKQEQTKTIDNYNKFIDEQVNLNLITFKLGDLIRCKFTSHQEEIIRIFQFLITMSEMSYNNNLFKIIRIKNRLNLSTRDILINAMFKQTIVCQIQLSVNENVSHKQKIMDKFNHFLYELKRSQMGVLLQLCNVWVNNCPQSLTFKKYIKQQNLNKKSLRQNICKYTIFQLTETNHHLYKLPFICNLCKIFYTRQQTVFKTVKFDKYPQPICGQCMSQRIEKVQRLKYLFSTQEKPVHLINYFKKFKLYQAVVEIFNLSQIKQHQFMIMIPINSRKINKFAILKIDTTQITYLVNNKLLENGKLQMKVMYEFYNRDQSIQQQQKTFFSKYCLFTFNRPAQMRPVQLKKTNFNGLLQRDLQKIHYYHNVNNITNSLLCLYLKFTENQYVLFPHYKDLLTDPEHKLKQNLIINKITNSVKSFKDVIQLSSLGLRDQISRVHHGIRVKINSIVRQIYVDDNELVNIDWVSDVLGLEILSARHNKITKIPKMPINIRIVDMAHNKLTRIQGFGSFNDVNSKVVDGDIIMGMVMGMKKQCKKQDMDEIEYCELRVLNLSHNLIQKIQGLQHMHNLRQLLLSHNNITDIQNLSQLKKLKKLNLSYNPINKINNLQELNMIEYLAMGNTLINSTRGINKLQSLSTLIMDSTGLGVKNKRRDNNKDRRHDDKQVNSNSNNNSYSNKNSYGNSNSDQLIVSMRVRGSRQPLPLLMKQSQSYCEYQDVDNLQQQLQQLHLPNNIKNLNLSNNQLHTMSTISKLQHLQQLILYSNNISNITLTQSLSNIKLLNLSYNNIQYIPDMKLIIQLKQLYLAHNVIQQIQGLEQNVFLSILDLSHNQIKQLKNIKYLINLNKLYAQNNLIQSIQPFDNLKTLKQLQLANNLITQILFTLPIGIKRVNLCTYLSLYKQENNQLQSIQFISQMIKKQSTSLTNNNQQQNKIDQLILKNNKIPLPMLLTIKHLLNIDGLNIVL